MTIEFIEVQAEGFKPEIISNEMKVIVNGDRFSTLNLKLQPPYQGSKSKRECYDLNIERYRGTKKEQLTHEVGLLTFSDFPDKLLLPEMCFTSRCIRGLVETS